MIGASGVWAPLVRRVVLTDFRSYPRLDLPVRGRLVVLVGENGAGKTNLLEAISLFSQGRGLRRHDLGEMAREQGAGGFGVAIRLDTPAGDIQLGTGIEPAEPGEAPARRCRVDRMPVPSAAAFAAHLRLVWLTPALDGLFAGPAGDRRRFLDRLVLAVDPAHGGRVKALERALRSRNRLLEDERADPAWLGAIEREIAEIGVAVAAARVDAVGRLADLARLALDDSQPFPWAELKLEGALESALLVNPALDVEDRYRDQLKQGRVRDRAAGRALLGPQTSDLLVRHGPKNIPAARASTGEQKALLIGLALAHARLVATSSGIAPVALLDEVAAHLDPGRRQALFAALAALGSQVFVTGADPAVFRATPEGAELFEVTPGAVRAIDAP